MARTILDAQSELELALRSLPKYATQLPEALKPLLALAPAGGSYPQVSFRHAKSNRQVKRTAPADAWLRELVAISYEPIADEPPTERQSGSGEARTAPRLLKEAAISVEDPARQLTLALATVEQDPQLNFISLKWFRDTYLTRQGFRWAASEESRHRILVEAIAKNWVVTNKLPNPKNPNYPVTAIRVNRVLPEVRAMLGPGAFGTGFAPIELSGEPLSKTVLRERR
jgi:hypothetical protein